MGSPDAYLDLALDRAAWLVPECFWVVSMSQTMKQQAQSSEPGGDEKRPYGQQVGDCMPLLELVLLGTFHPGVSPDVFGFPGKLTSARIFKTLFH